MDNMQKATYVISQSVCALAKIEGMKAENMNRQIRGESMAYTDKDFFSVIHEYAIDHNPLLKFFSDDF